MKHLLLLLLVLLAITGCARPEGGWPRTPSAYLGNWEKTGEENPRILHLDASGSGVVTHHGTLYPFVWHTDGPRLVFDKPMGGDDAWTPEVWDGGKRLRLTSVNHPGLQDDWQRLPTSR